MKRIFWFLPLILLLFSFPVYAQETGDILSVSKTNSLAGSEVIFTIHVPQDEEVTVQAINSITESVLKSQQLTGDVNDEISFNFIENDLSSLYPYYITVLGSGNVSEIFFIVPFIDINCGVEGEGQLFIGDIETDWSSNLDRYLIPLSGYSVIYLCAQQPGGWQIQYSDGAGNEDTFDWIADGTGLLQNIVITGLDTSSDDINSRTLQLSSSGVFSFKSVLIRDFFDSFTNETSSAVSLDAHDPDLVNFPGLRWFESGEGDWEIPANSDFTSLTTPAYLYTDSFDRTGNLDGSTTDTGGLTWSTNVDSGININISRPYVEISNDSGASGNIVNALVPETEDYNNIYMEVIIPSGDNNWVVGPGFDSTDDVGLDFICGLDANSDELVTATTASGGGPETVTYTITRDVVHIIRLIEYVATDSTNEEWLCFVQEQDNPSNFAISATRIRTITQGFSGIAAYSEDTTNTESVLVNKIEASNLRGIVTTEQGDSVIAEAEFEIGTDLVGLTFRYKEETEETSVATWVGMQYVIDPRLKSLFVYAYQDGTYEAEKVGDTINFQEGDIHTLRVETVSDTEYDLYLDEELVDTHTFTLDPEAEALDWGIIGVDNEFEVNSFSILSDSPTEVTPKTTQNKALILSNNPPFTLDIPDIARGNRVEVIVSSQTSKVYTDFSTKLLTDLDSLVTASLSSTFTNTQTIELNTTDPDTNEDGIVRLRLTSGVLNTFLGEGFHYDITETWETIEDNIKTQLNNLIQAIGWDSIQGRIIIFISFATGFFLLGYTFMFGLFPPAKIQFGLLCMYFMMIIMGLLDIINLFLALILLAVFLYLTWDRLLLKGE